MAFAIPSLLDVSRRIHASIRARLPGADGEIWPNNLRIVGKVVAMAAHEADLRAAYLFRQIFTSTAEGDYLDLHAYEVGLTRRPATAATGSLLITATPSVLIPAGVRFLRGDGTAVVTTAPVLGTGKTIEIQVAAEEPGPDGNAAPGVAFTLAAPFTGLQADSEVAPVAVAGGTARESNASLRSRILFRKRNRPRGGSEADYVAWALEVPGIARAFAKGFAPGAGAVSVWPLKEGSGTGAVPPMSMIERVVEHLETRRPAAATVYVHQAVAKPISIAISGLGPDVLAVRAEIQAELRDLFDERAKVAMPGEGAVFSRSWIAEAISAAIGEERHVLVSPAADVALEPGEFPVFAGVFVS